MVNLHTFHNAAVIVKSQTILVKNVMYEWIFSLPLGKPLTLIESYGGAERNTLSKAGLHKN